VVALWQLVQARHNDADLTPRVGRGCSTRGGLGVCAAVLSEELEFERGGFGQALWAFVCRELLGGFGPGLTLGRACQMLKESLALAHDGFLKWALDKFVCANR
jgi:hypothetical protein